MSYDKVKKRDRHSQMCKIAFNQQKTLDQSPSLLSTRQRKALIEVIDIRRNVVDRANSPEDAIDTLRLMIAPAMSFPEFAECSLEIEDAKALGKDWRNRLKDAVINLSKYTFTETGAGK